VKHGNPSLWIVMYDPAADCAAFMDCDLATLRGHPGDAIFKPCRYPMPPSDMESTLASFLQVFESAGLQFDHRKKGAKLEEMLQVGKRLLKEECWRPDGCFNSQSRRQYYDEIEGFI